MADRAVEQGQCAAKLVVDDEMEPADAEFQFIRTEFPTRPLDVRLRTDLLAAIESLAKRRGVPYQYLIQTWLLERLRQKPPDLLPQPR